jgi:hypothetical protein
MSFGSEDRSYVGKGEKGISMICFHFGPLGLECAFINMDFHKNGAG